jgi:hypothetical protein
MGLNVVGTYGFLARAHIAHEVAGEPQVANHVAQVSRHRRLPPWPSLVRARMHAREKSLKNFGDSPTDTPLAHARAQIEEFQPGSDCVELDPSPLCGRSCRRRSWSGWGALTSVTALSISEQHHRRRT